MRSSGRCTGCHEPIRWGKNATTGKAMPLNPLPDNEHGNIWIVGWIDGTPEFEVAANPDGVPASEPLRYTSHFATCPILIILAVWDFYSGRS